MMMIKKQPGVLSFQTICIIGTCFVFVASFSPPGCPCRLNVAYKCPVLPKIGCEMVYDYCGCCPQCALALGDRCQEFGTLCQTGLICLWDRFWYDEPLSGKCWYRGYARQSLSNSSLAVANNKLNSSTEQLNEPKNVTAATSRSTSPTAAHNSSASVQPTATETTIMTTNFPTTSATATKNFHEHFTKKATAIHYQYSKWSYLLGRNWPKKI